MRSVSDIMKASDFIREYANTPVKQIDKEAAVKNLQRLGILTKKKKIAAKYADVLVKIEDTQNASIRSKKNGQR